MFRYRAVIAFGLALCIPQVSRGGERIPSDVLLGLSRALANVKAFNVCSDLPDLTQSRALKVLPLSERRFLLQVRCALGAYNELSLIFAWDTHAPSALKLIVFPKPPEVAAPNWSRELGTVGIRDFDRKRGIVFGLEKLLGDGSGGFYSEYRIDRTTFVPELITAVYKPDADHDGGYNFTRGKRPSGKRWHDVTGRTKRRGYLIDVHQIDRVLEAQRAGGVAQ